MRVLTSEIARKGGERVTVAGWVHHVRSLGGVSFVVLRDRAGTVQLVCAEPPQVSHESVIEVQGTVVENAKAEGGFEIAVERLTVLSRAQSDLPIYPHRLGSEVTLGTKLNHRMLSLRAPLAQALCKVQAVALKYFADYLRSQHFTEIKSSKLIASGTEGGSGLFEVRYFDRSLYLAQSPQFYKQAMVASGLERVFEIGHAYRAEKHDTARHLNEYVSLDVEMGFIDDISALMDVEVEILCAVCQGVRDECAVEIERFGFDIPQEAGLRAIPRISYQRALEIVVERAADDKPLLDLNPEGEKLVCDWALEQHGVDAVFVTGFPLRKRPFYTMPDGDKSASFDLIMRGLELTTGGLRIHDVEMLRHMLGRRRMDVEPLQEYINIFAYGAPPHGGFAIGLERLVQQLCGMASVKEVALFPRDRQRVTP